MKAQAGCFWVGLLLALIIYSSVVTTILIVRP